LRLISVATLARTIAHDIKKDHANRPGTEHAEALAAALAETAPAALPPLQRARLVQIVAEEAVRIVDSGFPLLPG
jgi:hypothetical protein